MSIAMQSCCWLWLIIVNVDRWWMRYCWWGNITSQYQYQFQSTNANAGNADSPIPNFDHGGGPHFHCCPRWLLASMLMMSMEVITNIMRWAAYANVCDVCVFCCCCVGAGVPTTHILYGIPRYVDFQIIHTDSFIEFGICPFPQIKKSSPQNKHQTWKHLEIGEHVILKILFTGYDQTSYMTY